VRLQRTLQEDSLSGKKRKDKQVITPKITNTHELEIAKGGRCEDTEESERAMDTHLLESGERRTSEDTERKQARGTRLLESAERRTSEDTGRKRASERYSLPGEQSDGQVRAWKEGERERGTHWLETAERRTSEDMEGKQARGTDFLERRATDK
jgi:hypothetical protein